MRKSSLTDDALCDAVHEMAAGLIDADLGGGVVKKRIALPGRGKRGSVRTLVATRRGSLWFFVFGFEKAERGNISTTELSALKELGRRLLGLSGRELRIALEDGALEEICRDC